MTAVRLGNVIGSQGSVVPRFLDQIKQRTPLTVTHPEAARYFMTPVEAADIVSAAAWLGEGGDILVPDLGEPVRIVDLAKAVIASSSLQTDGGPGVVFTALQPGEKLSEELLGRDEQGSRIEDLGLTRVLTSKTELLDLCQSIAELKALALSPNVDALVNLVRRLVPEYTPSSVLLNG
jgi:FlaA1/EpsC-like NDP-sugar epimerase